MQQTEKRICIANPTLSKESEPSDPDKYKTSAEEKSSDFLSGSENFNSVYCMFSAGLCCAMCGVPHC